MGKFLCALLKNSLFWIIIIGLLFLSFHILFNILIAYLWSFLINIFVPSSYLHVKYFIILILFFYNWFIIRRLLISWLFEWQFPAQIFSIYKERQNYISYLKLRLRNFMNAIEIILDINHNISQKEIDDIHNFFLLLDEQFNIYDKLYDYVFNKTNNNNKLIRYSMSRCQLEYYNLLKAINHKLNENDIKKNLLDLKNNIDNIKMNSFNVNQNFENKKLLLQLNMLLKDFQKKVEKYDLCNYTYLSPAYLYNILFNDTFGSLSLNSIQFKKRLEEYNLEENFTPKNKIHYTLVTNKFDNKEIKNNCNILDNNLISENINFNESPLIIFCMPNGGCYELIPKIKIDFYLKLGFSFLCWNYKGYGYSKGRANFSNCKYAILEVYDTIVNNPKYHFKKICVMGHSIGGVPACYLAKNRKIDLLISDRNFCDITRLVNNFYCGKLLSTLIKILFIGNTDNIYNFFNSNLANINNNGIIKIKNLNNRVNNYINKIIIYSPLDVLILNDSTVKSGVARYIIKNYIIYINTENLQTIKNKENILDIIFNKNDKSTFINNFAALLHFYYNKDNNSINNKLNDIILNIKNENDNNIINQVNNNSNEQSVNDVLFSFFDKFFGICCDNLNYLSMHKLSLRRETIFLDNFFNNLLIWGVQKGDDNSENYFEFHSNKGKKILKEANDILIKYNSNKEKINMSPISRLIDNVSNDIKKILDVFENLDVVNQENQNNMIKTKKENNKEFFFINNNKNDLKEKFIINDEKQSDINTLIIPEANENNNLKIEEDSFFIKLNNIKGNIKLFKSFAGHNGLLRIDEREQFLSILLCTGILD